ncbi:hypothetical protein F2Q70_00003845 [Brassica cretica]|uniref:Uncharacterized protein n=1 Tax=Brassica cretica TaxID=69181 RepID=A0A8S9IL07_BRACR|nr:hypothetical protein F2Q70_00003845 [Brassica cretica]
MFFAMSKARADLVSLVHAQQYQKQQGIPITILTRLCKFGTHDPYMPSSTRSNKESQLIFSPDPASWERTIRKEASSVSTNNNTSVSLNSAQPPSTQTPVLSTDSRSPLSINNTNLPSTDTLNPTSIDIPSRTSIDTEPRDMVAPLILVRDNNGDLPDQEGHLRNAAVILRKKNLYEEARGKILF